MDLAVLLQWEVARPKCPIWVVASVFFVAEKLTT
jgi:hypothetical protein